MTIKLTREEAIQDLKAIKSFERYARGRLALDMAIEALKAQDRPIILDLISREDAIEAIEIVDWYHQNQNKDMVHGANDDEHQAWYKAQDIYKALEAVPSADRPRGEWIPVSERLPDIEQDVLATTTLFGIREVTFAWRINDSEWLIREGSQEATSNDILAWMPLPEAFKESDTK